MKQKNFGVFYILGLIIALIVAVEKDKIEFKIFIIAILIVIILGILNYFNIKKSNNGKLKEIHEKRQKYKMKITDDMVEMDVQNINKKEEIKFDSYLETIKEAKTEEIANEIRKNDEYFSDEKFKSLVKEIFSKISEDISKNEYEHIRMFTIEEVFNVYKKEIDEYKNNNTVRIIEKNRYPYCELTDYRIENDKEVLEVELHVILRDYIKSIITGNVMEGFPYKDFHERYILTFIRENGVKTKDEVFDSQKCPSCGAPLKINYVGECEYCHSIVTNGKYSWVLTNIDKKYKMHYSNIK